MVLADLAMLAGLLTGSASEAVAGDEFGIVPFQGVESVCNGHKMVGAKA